MKYLSCPQCMYVFNTMSTLELEQPFQNGNLVTSIFCLTLFVDASPLEAKLKCLDSLMFGSIIILSPSPHYQKFYSAWNLHGSSPTMNFSKVLLQYIYIYISSPFLLGITLWYFKFKQAMPTT